MFGSDHESNTVRKSSGVGHTGPDRGTLSAVTAPATETRRERQRRELVAEILASARRQLEEGGAGSVSWRGIARDVGMNPASLYTYFASLDDLYTALLIDSANGLADATRSAAAAASAELDDPLERIVRIAVAYRAWAVAHPHQYNLLFTDLIPGYEAPAGGPTVEAQGRIFGPFSEAFGGSGDAPDPELAVRLLGSLHGHVALEINHHFDWTGVDLEAVFDRTIRELVGPLLDAVRGSHR